MLKLKFIFLGKRSKQKVKLVPVIAAYGVCYKHTPLLLIVLIYPYVKAKRNPKRQAYGFQKTTA